ncbi:protein of unknown function [Porphyromonadaceae bacterium KH3R12]|jgi:hypothetical protein|uniref:DUF1599 domain-containing protein n=1 Tax=Proteiniphilum TaxID=294702 RepID=UPI0008953976|nr:MULTISPECIES: DUF1599 domain-containing protein [Proteiniphilum]MDY9919542.1 DUF1599 domain-containing protein [Proteiniphilum sp.]SEA28418.1 protein of unknown function [Porphyromonadaceae bacterium KH3R12]
MNPTHHQFDEVLAICRGVFEKKLQDYGAAWRILRPASVTDQIFIKAKRIRTLETTKDNRVDEGVFPEYIGIVNYGIIGLVQLELGCVDTVDITADKALELYDRFVTETKALMDAKNHDYGEAWRSMRMSSFTDLILMKIQRTKEIEANNGQTLVSEGIDANYKDMINYAVFGLIKLHFGEES